MADPTVVAPRRSALDFPLRNIGLLACFFALLKPSLFDLNSQITLACRLVAVLVLVWSVYDYARNGERLSCPLVLFVAFRFSMLIPTLVNEGDVLNWGYTTVSQVALYFLIEREMRGGRSRGLECLGVLRFLLLTYLVINCFMVLTGVGTVQRLMTDGEVTTWYLLGIRTRVTDCMLPALMVSMTIDSFKGERVGILTLVTLVVGLIQVLYLGVATAIIGMVVLVSALLTMRLSGKVRCFLSGRTILILGLVAELLVVVLRVQNGFSELLGNVFGKSVTLTGRTEIWDLALGIIAESPIFGYGVNDSFGAFVPWRGDLYWQSHNQWIQILYDGGFAALVLFVALVLACGRGLARGREADASVPAAATLLAYMVVMVSEIYTYNMGLFYVVLFVMAEVPNLGRESRDGPGGCGAAKNESRKRTRDGNFGIG